MLEYFRNRRNPILLYFVVGLICMVMLSFGLAIRAYRPAPTWALKINGHKVPIKHYAAAYRQTVDYFQNILRDQFTPEMMQYLPITKTVIENLKEQELLAYFAQKQNFVMSTQFVKDHILKNAMFQENGTFSYDLYKKVLLRGIFLSPATPKEYETYMGQLHLVRILNTSIRHAIDLPHAHQSLLKALRGMEYKVSLYPLSPGAITFATPVSDEMAKRFAEDPQNLAKLQNAYYANSARYHTKDVFEARHILLSANPAGSANAKALELYQTLKKTPSQFDALAKLHSEDPGSKSKGGYLGTFAAGEMVKPLEDALRKLKSGEVGEPTSSEKGIHIPMLVRFTPGRVTPLEAVKTELAKEVLAADKKIELIDAYKPILMAHFQNRNLKEVHRVITTVLKVAPKDTDYFSPYQADIPALTDTFALKKYLVHHGETLPLQQYLPEIMELAGTSYVVRLEDRRLAFGKPDDTGRNKGMEQFVSQMDQKWQDHVYGQFKQHLASEYQVTVNTEALSAFSRSKSEDSTDLPPVGDTDSPL